jgi:hypothetical protein
VKNAMVRTELVDSGQAPVVSFHEQGNEPSDFAKSWKFLSIWTAGGFSKRIQPYGDS